MRPRFESIGDIEAVETIAKTHSIRVLRYLLRSFGNGRWRKRKGEATVRIEDGTIGERSCTGTKRMGLGGATFVSSGSWIDVMKEREAVQFALCLADDLPWFQFGKVYRVLPDEKAARSHWIRVIDDLGEDYLYPSDDFVFLDLPKSVRSIICRRRPRQRVVAKAK